MSLRIDQRCSHPSRLPSSCRRLRRRRRRRLAAERSAPTVRAPSARSSPRRPRASVTRPGTDVTVGISGTGGGFERFCRGETDLSNASRPIDEDEAAICDENGVEYLELQVANDALTVVVNAENDWATCLTVEELNAMWKPGSTVTSWSDVRDGFPDEPLRSSAPAPTRARSTTSRTSSTGGGREPHRLLAERGRQRHRAGCLRRRRAGSATSASRTSRRTRTR